MTWSDIPELIWFASFLVAILLPFYIALILRLKRKRDGSPLEMPETETATISEMPEIVEALAADGRNRLWVMFVLHLGARTDQESDITVQFSVERHQVGFDWLLDNGLGEAHRERFERLAEQRGWPVRVCEGSGFHYLRIEGLPLTKIAQVGKEVLSTLYNISPNQPVDIESDAPDWKQVTGSMNGSEQRRFFPNSTGTDVDSLSPPSVEEIEGGYPVRCFRWAWWRVPLKVVPGCGLPLGAIYLYFLWPHPFMLALALVTMIFWPGPMVLPIILYPKPVIVSDRGFVICRIPFRWNEIRRLRVEPSPRDRSSVAFTYNASVKKRIRQIPLPKRHMLMLALPPVALFSGQNDLSFPNDLNINTKSFLHILQQYAQGRGE